MKGKVLVRNQAMVIGGVETSKAEVRAGAMAQWWIEFVAEILKKGLTWLFRRI